jgi:hypothetical protein
MLIKARDDGGTTDIETARISYSSLQNEVILNEGYETFELKTAYLSSVEVHIFLKTAITNQSNGTSKH